MIVFLNISYNWDKIIIIANVLNLEFTIHMILNKKYPKSNDFGYSI